MCLQITVEQILRESKELQEQDFKPPRQKISDPQELAEYRLRKRKEYEDLVRRVRWNQSVWVKVGCPCRTWRGPACLLNCMTLWVELHDIRDVSSIPAMRRHLFGAQTQALACLLHGINVMQQSAARLLPAELPAARMGRNTWV